MAAPLTLAFGLILGLLFAGFMVFKVLPQLDHVVKKEYGPAEACFFTRFCCLAIALPLYVFTIWMSVVIVASDKKGIAVLQDICEDDYSCANAFAWGRVRHDKEACTSLDCSETDLLARSGSQPTSLRRMGLGKDLEPSRFTETYACEIEEGSEFCVPPSFDDLEDSEVKQTCTVSGDSLCTTWTVETDSEKQFSFSECACVDATCTQFSCESLVMEYFYPNVFYAGLATILFVFPALVGTYGILKTQLRKIFKCADVPLFVYSQDAGAQHQYAGEDLVRGPGGFYKEQAQKTKYRTLSKYDLFGVLGAVTVLLFFSTLIIQVSGRVGLSFICLSATLIVVAEMAACFRTIKGQRENLNERVSKNNPMMEKAEF